ncbi:MAG TPA: hypothetical protein VMI12_04720 [Puia sp.]|nr:hypothetical protein [Puia sp.]
MIKSVFLFLLSSISFLDLPAEEIYINAKTGNDMNTGTKQQPLKTILEAAKRINANTKKEAATIILSEGIYPLTETVLFSNNKFSSENRLIIRAEVLPDDPNWNPQRMPFITSIIPGELTPGDGEEARGLEIELSHVTIEGLRFTGSPIYYYIDGKQSRRYYPIWRDGKNLDDLLITQCLFAGNVDVMPIRVAVIANGNGLTLDHCVFFNCENSVVFMEAEGGTSHHNVMRYCFVYESHYSGIWTTSNTANDFEFHHNIIANSRTGWIRDNNSTRNYQIHDCIFADNSKFTGNGGDEAINNDFLKMDNVQLSGKIDIEKKQGKNNYLQLKEGSFGSDLKAGLFKK